MYSPVYAKVCHCAVKTKTKPSLMSSDANHRRTKLVILGTGWGGYSLLRNINKKLFDVICISPRNHFLFTPLLASTTVGKL